MALALIGAVLMMAPQRGASAAEAKERDNRTGRQVEKLDADLTPAVLAARLAAEGEKRKSPFLLLAAAEIVGDLRISERSTEGIQAETSSDRSEPSISLAMADLIERARELAKDDEATSKAVEAVVASIKDPSRGLIYEQGKNLESVRIGGVVFKVLNNNSRLDPGDTYTLTNVIFEGRRPAIVAVVGDGDGDLDLWVYDGNTGGLIGSDTDRTSVCQVSWTTRYEGPFRIVVKNVGSVWERFFVLANW